MYKFNSLICMVGLAVALLLISPMYSNCHAEPAEGWIAFVSAHDIWAVRPDGTGLKQLTNLLGSENSPQWSADSSKIVYAKETEAQIWVHDWFTGANTKIYDGDDYGGQYSLSGAGLSPDGSKILFPEQKTYNNPHITVINANGSGRLEIPVEPGYVGNTSWSPTGTAFVYSRRNGGTATNDLWIYDFTLTGDIMNGINHRLTAGGSGDSTTKVNPDWTPSEDIVFVWGGNLAVIDPGQSPNWKEPISDPLDPNVTFLTDDASNPSPWYARPAWSPDLSQIVFDLYAPESNIWIMDACPDCNQYPLTGILGNQPDWGNPTLGTHDECAYAIAVEADEPYNGSTRAATGTDTSSCSDNDTNDVWHSFTPKFNYEYTISLCGSTLDTTLSVFDGCNGTELACNDDTEPGVCPDKWQSQLTMSLVKDLTYFIRVAGYDGETGDYTLTIKGPECTEPLRMDFNDDCKVDFRDFAIFSQSWLDCNLDPPELCWQ